MNTTNRSYAASAALLCSLLFSIPASADAYPVNGVWTAPDPEFPVASDEACFTVKTFGAESVARRSIAQIMIFTGDKRYNVIGNSQTAPTLQSAKAAEPIR